MIRELTAEDAQQFKDLRQKAFEINEGGFAADLDEWRTKPVAEVKKMLEQEYASMNDFILGAFEAEQLVGIIGFFRPSLPKISRKGHVWGTFLLPEWRGKRIAGQLLDELINRAQHMQNLNRLQLTTSTQFKAAISLYKSRGFTRFATETGIFHSGQHQFDELYMRLILK